MRQFIRPVGVELLLLPKYSPDLNPIERDLVKLEHSLRNAAARTLDDVGQLLEPTHRRNAPTSWARTAGMFLSAWHHPQ